MNQQYKKGIEKSLNGYYTMLGLNNIPERIEARLSRKRAQKIIEVLDNHIKKDHLKTLDIGCGWGEMILEFQEWDKADDIYGVEPDQELYELSKMVHPNIFQSGGEALPFDDNTFDLVLLNDVLEHVQDHKQTLKEMLRVVKDQGFLYISFPNYAYPAEGHYKVKALPFSYWLPKKFNSFYLKYFQHRDPYFWENYVNPIAYSGFKKIFNEILKETGFVVKISDYSVSQHKFNFLYGPINAKFVIQVSKTI